MRCWIDCASPGWSYFRCLGEKRRDLKDLLICSLLLSVLVAEASKLARLGEVCSASRSLSWSLAHHRTSAVLSQRSPACTPGNTCGACARIGKLSCCNALTGNSCMSLSVVTDTKLRPPVSRSTTPPRSFTPPPGPPGQLSYLYRDMQTR